MEGDRQPQDVDVPELLQAGGAVDPRRASSTSFGIDGPR